MAKGTPATTVLEKRGVAFKLHEYDYDPDADDIAMQAAGALGVEPGRVFKTLMIRSGKVPFCVIVPADRRMNLKHVATVFGVKSVEMMPPGDAERLTGYKVGGISPLGQRQANVRVALDGSAMDHETMFLNGGRRGLQIEIVPALLVETLGATVADVT